VIQAIRTLYLLFTPAQRRGARWLVLLMFGGMVLETLGVGMVVPAILLLTSQSLPARFPALAQEAARLGIDTPTEFMVAGMLGLAAVYTIKCFYVAWTLSRQMRFVYAVQADISQRLFVGYLHKPWTFHLQRNSAELVRNVVNATDELTLTGLVSLLILVTETFVLAGISALLLWIEPVGTLVAAGFLAIFGFTLNRATRNGIRRAGEAKQVHEERRIRYLQQAIGGAKELKLLGREQNAVEQYSPSNAATAAIGRRQATLQALPKLWLELLAVLGLVALVLALIWQGKPVDRLVPTLGMFAAAAFRLIPSMHRILGSLQFIRYSIPTINMLDGELGQLEPAPAPEPAHPPLPFAREIVAEQVSVRYPGSEARVLERADFRIARGTTVGFIGGSGAGKSTLVDALLGLLPLDGGAIRVDGVDIHADLRGWQAQIGYVPQSIYLTDDSLRRNIAFGLPDAQIDEAALRRALAAAQLDEFVASLPEGLDTVTGERGVRLSGGQRQRIGIARALYHNPAILVLDEATSALDADTESGVMQAIAALHGAKTILIVTHRAATLRYCDRVIRIAGAGVHEVTDGAA
jgi:ABC-type multidrug transport system fused ATPase/permease subunit